MPTLDVVSANLLSPPILCFALGAFAVLIRSDFKLDDTVFSALSIFLMLAIGLKGGAELAGRPIGELAGPLMAAVAMSCLIPLWSFAVLRVFAKLPVPDAAALAAHYGSVSAVTFAAVTALLDRQGVIYEGYVAALLAVMEVPAIAIAILLAGLGAASSFTIQRGAVVVSSGAGPRMNAIIGDALSSKSILLLAGGLMIGALSGPSGLAKVKPLFIDLFQGVLCLFLLELGRLAASRIREFRQLGFKLCAFAIAAPILHGALGVLVGYGVNMTQGGAVILGTLCASASYIAAPAAVRLAIPEANPGYYLTCSLAITFPFNLCLGIPLYYWIAKLLYP